MYEIVLWFFKRISQKYNSFWIRKEKLKLYQEAKACYICGKGILQKFSKDKIMEKSGIIVITQVNIDTQEIVCKFKI